MKQQEMPMLFGKSRVATAHGRGWTCPLRVQCCPLQMSPITQPLVRYIRTTVAHRCTQFCTTTLQSPHWLQWDAPYSPPKLPLPFRRSPPHLIHPSLDRPTHHSKRHPDPISRLPTIHPSVRQTDRLTDQQTD